MFLRQCLRCACAEPPARSGIGLIGQQNYPGNKNDEPRPKPEYVGLSNILDSELQGRKPAKGPHREVIRTAIMDSKLLGEVIQGIKAVTGVKALLVLPVAALYFAVMSRRIGADELMTDAKLGGSGFKQSGDVPLAVGKAVSKLKAIIRLDTFHPDAPAGIPLEQPFEEVSGGIGGLLRIGGQEAQTSELINGGILEQAKLLVCNTLTGHYFHIYLDSLARIGHLFIRFGLVCFLLLWCREQP